MSLIESDLYLSLVPPPRRLDEEQKKRIAPFTEEQMQLMKKRMPERFDEILKARLEDIRLTSPAGV